MAEKWENWPKNGSRMAIFPWFRPFFPFSRWGQNPFFGHFFPISGRSHDLGSVQGNRDRKARRKPLIPELLILFRMWLGCSSDVARTCFRLSCTPSSRSYPKNRLRLFLRNNLRRLEITSEITKKLKRACFSLFLYCLLGVFKITSRNKNNFPRLTITSKKFLGKGKY